MRRSKRVTAMRLSMIFKLEKWLRSVDRNDFCTIEINGKTSL